MKCCTVCRKHKPPVDYYNSKATKDGKSYRCKSCDTAARKLYHEKHYQKVRVKQRDNQRKCKYGLSKEGFDLLMGEQLGKCACCGVGLDDSFGKHHKPNKLVVDHCHETGVVRGILCTMCNKGIGLLGDTESGVNKALLYLRKSVI